MAVFYQGLKPVHPGRNVNDAVNPYKGTAGTYSYYPLFHTGAPLAGAPNVDHVPGEGREPHGLQLSMWFNGLRTEWPLDDPGSGARLSYHRTHPFLYKGLDSTRVFVDDFGHEDRVTPYSVHTNFVYAGITPEPLTDPGHEQRTEGGAATFGAFHPFENKGISVEPLEDAGHPPIVGSDNVLGHNKINEWRGVPSAQALGV